ncbi:TrbC family F-type conjugative pilus assembly protein [Endozoicomonas sp. NE40]|uniref:Type-F conjugative transfer system pilin assembly protein TrbC n=1 Tax=Endozoicomonas lisbonensis TaxID=3120522 RepID=A0ABV2SNG4_9GAMM
MIPLPFRLVMIVLLLPANTALSSALTINLFVSETMGETALVEILRETELLQNLNIIVRGMGAKDTNLTDSITRWQYRIKQADASKSIQINPVLFREQNIYQVPAMAVVMNGNTELTVFGVTSPVWVMRQYHAGKRGNIGAYGSTLPISEPDLLESLLQRLKQQNWKPLQEKGTEAIADQNLFFRSKAANQSKGFQQNTESVWQLAYPHNCFGYQRPSATESGASVVISIP